MNIDAISSMARRSHDFEALQSTVQSGNIPAAQAAFATFLQDVHSTSTVAGTGGMFAPGTQAGRDLDALGGALRSANLTGAQQALTNLKQDLQAHLPASATAMVAKAHHSKTAQEIAANGVAIVDQAKSAGPSAAISSLLNLKV